MKVLAYLIGVISSLAGWIKVLLYLLVAVIAVAIAGYFGVRAAIITALVAVGLGALLLAYGALGRWMRQRKEAELRGDVEASGLRRRAVDPGLAARLEALRSSFDVGLGKIHAQGKNVYELPWFVVIGERGAGKSEAVRQSGLELPQNLQDRNQGLGSTGSLDWWFTNYAILLDLAGDAVFGFGDTPTTATWQELLNLLARHRRDCPLNGVILAISAESLLQDSSAEGERKAGVIARHLDTLRQTLGVRLPVFVVITKCDQLPGFRPFFTEVGDEAAQRQMLGWSNPAALEAPFRPELCEEFFQSLAQRLRRRRLGILLNPSPRREGGRRADEVDALFDLPQSLPRLLPNLRRYLDNVFVAGEWSAQPLFLRGVYLTSALPTGDFPATTPSAAFDRGTAVGGEAAPAPTGGLFLRDLFLDKVFREDGLVTRAGSGVYERFQRRLLLFGVGVLILAALFFAALIGARQLAATATAQLGLWERATNGWRGKAWEPIVVETRKDSGLFRYRGGEMISTPAVRDGDDTEPAGDFNLVDFHRALAETSATPIPLPWVFQPFVPFSTNPNSARPTAQRVVFEASVVRPLLEAARAKMARVPAGPVSFLPGSDPAVTESTVALEIRALAELVRVEIGVVARSDGKSPANPGSDFIPTLLEYTTGTLPPPKLVTLMNWIYGDNPAGLHRWAPDWASGGNSLAENPAIAAGIDRLLAYAQTRTGDMEQNLSILQSLANDVSDYATAETQLSQAANIKDDFTASSHAVANDFESLEAKKVAMEKSLQVVRVAGLFEDGPETLSGALGNVSTGKTSSLGAVEEIVTEIDAILPATPAPSPGASPTSGVSLTVLLQAEDSAKYALLREIKQRLSGLVGTIQTNVDGKINDQLLATYRQLDANVLGLYQNLPSYLWRWNAYQQCTNAAPQYQFQPSMYLVGARWQQLGDLISAVDGVQTQVDTYQGAQTQVFLTICNYFLQRVRTIQTGLFMNAYVQQARDALLRVARFPLVWPPGPDSQALDLAQVQGAKALLDAIAADVETPLFTGTPTNLRQSVLDFIQRTAPLAGVVEALLLPNNQPARVAIFLYNGQAQRQLSGPNFAPLPTPTPAPSPPPRSLMSKVFFGLGSTPPPPPPPPALTIDPQNWNAVSLVGGGPSGAFPLTGQADVPLGSFNVTDAFGFTVYHSILGGEGSDVSGGNNWSALRLIAQLGGKPLGVGQDWQLALKPNEPNAVWLRFSFSQPLPTTPWPTIDSLGLTAISSGPPGEGLPDPGDALLPQ